MHDVCSINFKGYMCVYIMCACAFACMQVSATTWIELSERREQSISSSGGGITNGCELISVVGTKLGSSVRTIGVLKHRAISPAAEIHISNKQMASHSQL